MSDFSIETPVRVAEHPTVSPAIPLAHSFINQALTLGVPAQRPTVLEALGHEVKRFHPAVNGSHVKAAADLAFNAQRKFRESLESPGAETARSICLATTSCVVDHAYGPEAIRALINHIRGEIPNGETRLFGVVNEGSSESQGDLNSKLIQFVGQLIRHVAVHGDQKLRIVLPQEMRQFIRSILVKHIEHNPYPPRPGGMSLVNALQARAFFPPGGVYMFCMGEMPGELVDFFPSDIKIVNQDPSKTSAETIPRQKGWDGHFALHSNGTGDNPSILPNDISEVLVDGVPYARDRFNKFDTLITGRKVEIDLAGVPKEWISRLRGLDAVQLTGVHKLDNLAATKSFLGSLKDISSEGCSIALSYTETRDKTFEMTLWGMIRDAKVIDLLSANVGEILQFGKRLHSSAHADNPLGLTERQIVELDRLYELGKSGQKDHAIIGAKEENPCFVAEVALFLQEVLQIPMVRIRGKLVDAVALDAKIQLDSISDLSSDLVSSRYLALQKVAHPDGLLTSREHIGFALDIPSAESVAGLQSLADDLTERSLPSEAAKLPFEFSCKLVDGRTLIATPTAGFSVFDGGTVSAGDLMDLFFIRGQARRSIAAAHQLNLSLRS